MGNQGASGDGVRQLKEWYEAGIIGEVNEVHCWTNRPVWPQGISWPATSAPVPSELDWDLWLGSAPYREYVQKLVPFNWRGWWDFGTGALGDMACHILHPVFKGLKLKYPTLAEGTSTLLLTDCAPNAQMVKLVFPERQAPKGSKVKYPEVEVTWVDGGLQPMKPAGWPAGKAYDPDGGCIFHGSKDILICGCYGRDPWLLSGRVPASPKTERRVTTSHEMDWVAACKEPAESRTMTKSDFSEAGPFNEMVVMGVLAVRLQGLNKTLQWNGEKMEFTNIGDDETLKICLENHFNITDGHPTFDTKYTDPINAKQFAAEMIKHNYRDDWSLPEMPA